MALPKPRVNLINRLLDLSVLPGMLGFTKQAHGLRQLLSRPLPETLTGRRVVITGATSGLGLATAHRLAAMGADLVLVGRDAGKLTALASVIRAEHGVDAPQTEKANLELMTEVRDLAQRLLSDPAPIDVLINNAGALFPERELTAEGNERSLAVNLMSPYLLTTMLMPRLIESAPARVINVSSGGMYTQRIDIDDLQFETGDYDGARAYARAKRGQVILTERWAKELADKNVVVHAMHPGWADTPGVRKSLPAFYRFTRPVLRTAAQGADTIVWLAAAKEPAGSTGGFWLDREPHLTYVLPGTRETEHDRQRLHDILQEMTKPGA